MYKLLFIMVYRHLHFSLLPMNTVTPKESKLRPLKLSRNELEVRVKEMATIMLPISDNDDWTRNRIDHNLEMKSKVSYGVYIQNLYLKYSKTLIVKQ